MSTILQRIAYVDGTLVVAIRLIGEPVPANLPPPLYSAAITSRWITDSRIKVGDTINPSGGLDGIGNPPSVFLAKAGDTMVGTLNMNNQRVTNLPAPAASTDAARKSDVDDARAYALSLAFTGGFPAMAGQARKVLTNNGSTPEWSDADGPRVPLTVANNGLLLAVRTTYELNSSGGAFLVNLPTMAVGDWIKFVDVTGALPQNNVTVGRNGQLIRGTALDLVLDVAYDSFELVRNATGVIEQ